MKDKAKFNEWQRSHRAKRKRARDEQLPPRVFKHQTDVRLSRDRLSKLNWNRANREYRAEHHMKTTYGITHDQYLDMLSRQGYRCALNPNHVEDNSVKRRNRFWHIDHDHRTGRVRGILCRTCNTALGSFGDDLDGLLRAVDYLNRHYGLSESVDEHY